MATGFNSRFDNFRRQCSGSDRPKLKDLYKYVTPCYAAHWEDIGIYLDVELGHLETIRADHPGDTSGCCKGLWKKWLELDPDATWEKLFDAVDSAAPSASESSFAGIHSTATSKPATTMKCSPLNVTRLKARYIKQLPTSKTDWPKHKVTQYVRLALVEKEDVTLRDKHLNELTRLTLQGDVDKILKKKEPLGGLRDIFHYENKPCPRLILIMGGPGIGKTTLANEICIQWARDEFLTEDFDIVILIPLRSVQQRSLEEVIVEHTGEENYQQLKKSAGNRCLIILEGFDEMAVDRRISDPFLLRLIKECTILEEATVIITSRPHACEEIDSGRKVEVVGFGKDEIREFVEKSFPKDAQSVEEFLRQLNEYPHLHSLCYIPMNLVMIVDIFHCSEKKLPSTVTELYQLFIVMTLNRQVKKENVAKRPICSSVAVTVVDSVKEALCVMLRGIPKETVGILVCLSRLAYRGFFDWYCHREDEDSWAEWKNPKIIFTESDLVECDIDMTSDFDGFGLLKATHTHQLPIDINIYSFNHLTIQEFLCAVYISLQSQQEQLHLLREHFDKYPNVFTFVCGLTGLSSREMFQFISSKLKPSVQSIFSGDPNLITAVRCVNESKQSCGPHQSVSPFTLHIIGTTLLPYDCVCVSDVLSSYPVSQLRMISCSIDNKGTELLVKHYPSKNNTGQLLEELDLRSNDFTSEGMVHVMKIVRTSSATLKVLNLSYNHINDQGIAVLSEALQHNKSLITLRVVQCGLSVKGAISISEMMTVNHSLQELWMDRNNIGDNGISAIAEALGNCKINKLSVNRCGIGLTGAKSLAAILTSNNTIRELWLEGNPITAGGALLIVKSVVHNTVCKNVMIDAEYKNDEVMNILENKGKQEKSTSSKEDSISRGEFCSESNKSEEKSLEKHKVTMEINNSSEELVHTLPIITGDGATVNMEMSLTNQSEDDHSGGQEETRGYHSD